MRAIKYYYSGVAQLVRAPGLRSGGRKFESCHLAHLYFRENNTPFYEKKD